MSAAAYVALGQHTQARGALAAAIQRQPQSAESWKRVGQLDLSTGDAALALPELQHAQLLGSAAAGDLIPKAQAAVNAQHARAAAAAKRATRGQRGR